MNPSAVISSVSVCVFALISSTTLPAAVISFAPQQGNTWDLPINWNPGIVPTSVDFVEIMGNTTAELAGANANASYIDIRENGVLNVTGGDLSFGFSNNRWMWVGWQTEGTVNQSGGSISTSGSNVDLIVDNFGTFNLTGGLLNISDDLRLNGNAVFNISGSSELSIGDDFRIGPGSNVQFNIKLIGNSAPIINISDDFALRNGMSLHLDTTDWTGGAGPVSLFNVADRISGQLAQVTVNGVEVPDTEYQVTAGSFVIPVSETTSPVHAIAGILGVFFVCSRRHKRITTDHRTSLAIPAIESSTRSVGVIINPHFLGPKRSRKLRRVV
jgi:hypothetical protein